MTNLTLHVRPDAVAVLTLDQPGSKANVLTSEMWADLEAAVDEVAARTGLRGLVIASAKPGIFIAGADLKLLANASGPNDPAVRAFIDRGLRVLEKLEALPFPTCAAIDGAALGGGFEVALACDYRAFGEHPKARVGLPEVTLNLIPGWGGTQRLPRIAGVTRALEMALTAQEYRAVTAATDPDPTLHVGRLGDLTAPSDVLIDRAAAMLMGSADWSARRAVRRGPVPNEPISDLSLEKLVGLTDGQWNRMFLEPSFFDAHRDYVRTGMADSLNRDAHLAVIDVIEAGAPLPLAEAIPLETEAFMRLAGSPESKQLIAAFFASRKK